MNKFSIATCSLVTIVLSCALLLLVSCSIKPVKQASATEFPASVAIPTALPKHTEVPLLSSAYPNPVTTPLRQDAYPYPVPTSFFQATSYPAPVETDTPILPPTATVTTTATQIRPTPTFPAALAALRVAYMSGKQLMLWDRGESKLLAELEEASAWVSISSDGERIAYKLSSGLWGIRADGTGQRLLVEKDRLQVVNPNAPGRKSRLNQFKWIPNTHRLLLNTDIDTEGQCCYIDNGDLYMVDADTLELQTLLPSNKAGAVFIVSPDGKYVALISSGSIDVLNIHTREVHNLIQYEPVQFGSEVGGYLSPIWSSDSQYLMVVVPPFDIYYGTQQPTKIWKLPLNHAAARLIAVIGPEFGLVTLSPDFSKIATKLPVGTGGDNLVLEMHVANADGSDDEIYQRGEFFFTGWSPDSAHFIFNNGNGASYLGRIEGKPIAFPFPTYNLRWIDGQSFFYQVGNMESGQIRLGFIDGSSRLLIGPAAVNNYDFAW